MLKLNSNCICLVNTIVMQQTNRKYVLKYIFKFNLNTDRGAIRENESIKERQGGKEHKNMKNKGQE